MRDVKYDLNAHILTLAVPDEFMYNPVTRSYGEPHKRPEVQNSTVEFIASSDYMVSDYFDFFFRSVFIHPETVCPQSSRGQVSIRFMQSPMARHCAFQYQTVSLQM